MEIGSEWPFNIFLYKEREEFCGLFSKTPKDPRSPAPSFGFARRRGSLHRHFLCTGARSAPGRGQLERTAPFLPHVILDTSGTSLHACHPNQSRATYFGPTWNGVDFLSFTSTKIRSLTNASAANLSPLWQQPGMSLRSRVAVQFF